MKVHEAARSLGVTPRTLRFYEEKGLVHPYKEPYSGYRAYSGDDMTKLRWIVSLRELGMPLSVIKEALQTIHQPSEFIRIVDHARAQLYEEWVAVTQSLQALDHTIRSWQQLGETQLADAEAAASRMKQNRRIRDSWSDQWNYNEMAARYGVEAPLAALEGLITSDQYEHALIRTLEWIDPKKGERGLELGGGSGNLSAMLDGAGADLTIVEQSPAMIQLLHERMPASVVKQGNMLALPLVESNFAFIGCSFAFRHLSSSQQLLALEEMDRVLLPGGRIIITDIMQSALSQKQSDTQEQQMHLQLRPIQEWFEARGYSVVAEALDPTAVWLIYALRVS
ncbi:MerR family transcriptional regulator [Paenibacillus harenae]|uniref:MerR family transcriptional regulator n=1 Tax=Paenibacillus harenae TaxID=306543 RepID=UPI00279481C1|nr:MerR family transcriptional regulator [Paenibacillus harenae]MDQ0058140.1 putative AdoMet-dependent methyltransferase [Paenibacillus harenae]